MLTMLISKFEAALQQFDVSTRPQIIRWVTGTFAYFALLNLLDRKELEDEEDPSRKQLAFLEDLRAKEALFCNALAWSLEFSPVQVVEDVVDETIDRFATGNFKEQTTDQESLRLLEAAGVNPEEMKETLEVENMANEIVFQSRQARLIEDLAGYQSYLDNLVMSAQGIQDVNRSETAFPAWLVYQMVGAAERCLPFQKTFLIKGVLKKKRSAVTALYLLKKFMDNEDNAFAVLAREADAAMQVGLEGDDDPHTQDEDRNFGENEEPDV